ncbi:MAG: hypothetical protein A3F67_07220 [Verrucomicrobia bacterium RIFCSPHIGHO2_12_FULL_41_10]|nr:MAG: hypothetical protein A3F67_07220 [Verrucomicrobia bacterium RIFCSPHIGHO2_12_FULL_41_10]HLB34254.1 ankyrin repeat domain-containing protein [Chthoniobacterales bacterium]
MNFHNLALPSDEERYEELLKLSLDYARQGETKALCMMLEHGLPVTLSNAQGNSLLMLAAYHDHPETVQMLLERGAEPDKTNDRGQTSLAGVAFKGYLHVAKLLLSAGADPLIPQGMGMTPLSFAMLFGRTEVQQLMEQHLALSETKKMPFLLHCMRKLQKLFQKKNRKLKPH